MNPLLKLLASTILLALSLAPAHAEDNGAHPSGNQYTVCSAILESCFAACSLEDDSGAVLTPQDVCEMQCTLAYQQCMKGYMRTSVALRQSKVNPLQNFIGDGTPNTTPAPPAGGTDQPTDPTGGKGGGEFNPGAVSHGPATTVIR
jgi:hypothetical protein